MSVEEGVRQVQVTFDCADPGLQGADRMQP